MCQGNDKNITIFRTTLIRFSTDYEVTGLMGIGGGGCVFDAVNKHDEVKYAVKRIHVDPR